MPGPKPVQAKEITARQGVPQRYLEQVMQQLVRAGIPQGRARARAAATGWRASAAAFRWATWCAWPKASRMTRKSTCRASDLGQRIVAPLVATLQEELMSGWIRFDRGSLPAGPSCRGRSRNRE
jgi:hypothetical protein